MQFVVKLANFMFWLRFQIISKSVIAVKYPFLYSIHKIFSVKFHSKRVESIFIVYTCWK